MGKQIWERSPKKTVYFFDSFPNDNGDDGDSDKDISEQAPGTFEQATKIPLPSYYKGLTSEVETETETN